MKKITFASLVWKGLRRGTVFLLLTSASVQAQTVVPLTDLSFFKSPGNSWQLAGDLSADLNKDNSFNLKKGSGVLVNLSDENRRGQDLFTNMEHGDLDLELDYMMAKGANSGIYLQGRYEVQLFDSWGVASAKSSDNGGIYERWDDARPEGQQGYEGTAPRQNVSRAPGLWQHMKIVFQAPRFDASGHKIENASMLRVELNGVLVQEGISLSGPTRSSASNIEVPSGPLMLQGDHGTVAFRNIRITKYDKPRPELANLHYRVYEGKFETLPDYNKLKPKAEGAAVILSSNITPVKNEFLLRYTGTLQVKESGEYHFSLNTPGGDGFLKINNQPLAPESGQEGQYKATLLAGNLPFELIYSKYNDWANPGLGLSITGPGIREFTISDANTSSGEMVDPILVNAGSNTLLHSFMDIPGQRIVHAVNVGSPLNLHYTYDMEKGSVVQLWRGGFLDATPMWHERGDGSSRPVGTILALGKSNFLLQKLSSLQQPWPTDSAGTVYRPKGYRLDEANRPAFRYLIYGNNITDAIYVTANGKGIRREITMQGPTQDIYALLASGRNIEMLPGGIYAIDDRRYYIQVDDAAGVKPIIRESGGQQELLLPAGAKIIYTILF
ncbi:family 16 glycoside hydrolase [Flavihumibacter profundi]|uniref:family 16 glycoside hydrolase n=1 Tax=Flavihumibacter profundi TaxID=2716883 RepID=UPI001CC5BECB|nr:family 16 glycoside hydrolase [Flavihumibacter profundi]MBZ5858542.1 DUF1080 domain-containing protein [Flavihumibacter profundi]